MAILVNFLVDSIVHVCVVHVHVSYLQYVLPVYTCTPVPHIICVRVTKYIIFIYICIHVSYIIHVLESIIIIHDVYTFTCALVSSPFSFTLFPKWINCPFRPWFVNFLSTLIDTR